MQRLKVLYTILVLTACVLFAYLGLPYWLPLITGNEEAITDSTLPRHAFTRTTAKNILKTVTSADKRFAHSLSQEPEPPGKEPEPALVIAVEKIHKAAELGFAHAQFSLAERFRLGKGVKPDELRSVEWLNKAARQGYVQAQLMLGFLYLGSEEHEVERDLAQTYFWWSQAAEQGNTAAIQGLRRLEENIPLDDLVRARVLEIQLGNIVRRFEFRGEEGGPSPSELLVRAASRGDEAMARVLLVKGADANATDEDGRTAVINAAWRGHDRVIKLLLDYGAECDSLDYDGKTALIWAAINGHDETSGYLISSGANVNTRDDDGLTALMRAAWNGRTETVAILLASGADPYITDDEGNDSFHYAGLGGDAEIIGLLREYSLQREGEPR